MWVQVYSGKKFYPLAPKPEDVDINDIIHALSLKCRFTGHCNEFYSVAQHSILVADHLPNELKLLGLMHDAAEAYLPDVARPYKAAIGFEEIERPVWEAIATRYGLPKTLPPLVTEADDRALMTEARDLMKPPPEPWATTATPFALPITGWHWLDAESEFRRCLRCHRMDC